MSSTVIIVLKWANMIPLFIYDPCWCNHCHNEVIICIGFIVPGNMCNKIASLCSQYIFWGVGGGETTCIQGHCHANRFYCVLYFVSDQMMTLIRQKYRYSRLLGVGRKDTHSFVRLTYIYFQDKLGIGRITSRWL